MANGAELARAFPDIVFVLEHAGMPENRSRDGVRQWREGMKRLAELPNVSTKLSGLGTFIRRNDTQHIADVVGETLEVFGPESCMWGSNFPIEKALDRLRIHRLCGEGGDLHSRCGETANGPA